MNEPWELVLHRVAARAFFQSHGPERSLWKGFWTIWRPILCNVPNTR